MGRERCEKHQVWATVDNVIYNDIEYLAKKEKRKVTQMVAILIESAVNERKRKRKNAKEE